METRACRGQEAVEVPEYHILPIECYRKRKDALFSLLGEIVTTRKEPVSGWDGFTLHLF